MDADRAIASGQAAAAIADANVGAALQSSDALAAMIRAINVDQAWQVPIALACMQFDISTPRRRSMFLAQCAHESAAFTRLVESLHYSSGALLSTWPQRFTPAEAVEFAYDDIRIAERVYGGRMGNQPEGGGDGWRYRGRGLLQLTGRASYAACGAAIELDLDAHPEDLEQPFPAALSAAWYWAKNGCNALADDGRFQSIVLRINGGMIGMQERLAWLDRLQGAAA